MLEWINPNFAVGLCLKVAVVTIHFVVWCFKEGLTAQFDRVLLTSILFVSLSRSHLNVCHTLVDQIFDRVSFVIFLVSAHLIIALEVTELICLVVYRSFTLHPDCVVGLGLNGLKFHRFRLRTVEGTVEVFD